MRVRKQSQHLPGILCQFEKASRKKLTSPTKVVVSSVFVDHPLSYMSSSLLTAGISW